MGEENVDALARRLTAKQFMEWEWINEMDPIGPNRADYHFALIAYILWAVNVDEKAKKKHPMKIEDFLLKFEEVTEAKPVKKKQTWQDQLAIARIMAMSAARMQKERRGRT